MQIFFVYCYKLIVICFTRGQGWCLIARANIDTQASERFKKWKLERCESSRHEGSTNFATKWNKFFHHTNARNILSVRSQTKSNPNERYYIVIIENHHLKANSTSPHKDPTTNLLQITLSLLWIKSVFEQSSPLRVGVVKFKLRYVKWIQLTIST